MTTGFSRLVRRLSLVATAAGGAWVAADEGRRQRAL